MMRRTAALVAIALPDDARRAARGGSASICRCAVAPSTSSSSVCSVRVQDERAGDRPADRSRCARRGDGVEHAIERAVLAVEEHLVLAVEVVVEVRRRQVGGDGDVAHAGVGEAALAKEAGGRAQDGVALARRAAGARRRPALNRTAVRFSNHGSHYAPELSPERLFRGQHSGSRE